MLGKGRVGSEVEKPLACVVLVIEEDGSYLVFFIIWILQVFGASPRFLNKRICRLLGAALQTNIHRVSSEQKLIYIIVSISLCISTHQEKQSLENENDFTISVTQFHLHLFQMEL